MCRTLLSRLQVAIFLALVPLWTRRWSCCALRLQNLLFPLPSGSLGPNRGVFAIPKMLEKCRLIVNLVPVNRAMPEKPEKFWLPSREVLALLAQVAQQGSSFSLPSFYGWARCLRPAREVPGLTGGGGMMSCVCAILTSVFAFGQCASRRHCGIFPYSGWPRGRFVFLVFAFWVEVQPHFVPESLGEINGGDWIGGSIGFNLH